MRMRLAALRARLNDRREHDLWTTYGAVAHLQPTHLFDLARYLDIRPARVARALATLQHRGFITSTWPDSNDLITYRIATHRNGTKDTE